MNLIRSGLWKREENVFQIREIVQMRLITVSVSVKYQDTFF